ncbi:MAG: DMT family transporter [Bacteroidota bacterium]
MSKNIQSHLSLFAVNLIYGVNFLIAKGLMPALIGPSGFIVIRVIGATLMFGLLWLFLSREKITNKKDLGLIALCAVFGVAVNQLFFFNGLCLTSPINASIIMVSTPVLVLGISSVLIKERITGRKLVGLLLGTLGAVALILTRGGTSTGSSSLAGDIMVFLNALSYAIYLVIVKPLMLKYKPLTVITYVFLFGLPMVIPFGWTEFRAVNWNVFNTGQWLAIAFVVIFVTFLAYLLNTFALKYVTASVSSVYIYMQPFVATVLMYIIAVGFGGPSVDLTLVKVLCGVSIFSGVFLVTRK